MYSVIYRLWGFGGIPEQIEKYPSIYPDYIGVTVPRHDSSNNFSYTDTSYERVDVYS